MTPSKTVIKSIFIGKSEIEWYSLSSAYADVPDCIIIKKAKQIDTVCKANNIADIKDGGNNTLIVSFPGRPLLHFEEIKLPATISNIQIITDTTAIFKTKSNHP